MAKTPKSIERLAATVAGSTIQELSFRMHGRFAHGWAIVDKDQNELIECEPLYYSNGDKWLIKNKCFNRHFYVKSLRGLDTKCQIQAGHTGYKFSNSIKTEKLIETHTAGGVKKIPLRVWTKEEPTND